MIILEKGERADQLWGMNTEIITDEMIEALEQGKRLYLTVNDEYAVVIKKDGKRKAGKPEAIDTDTISRQAVLDAIFSEPLYESGMKKRDSDIIVPAIYEKIKALPPSPSIEPDPDTVSRQAARDAVCEELDSIDHVPQWVFDRLTKKIENLPPSPTVTADADTISRQKVISTINVLRPRCDTDDIDDYHDLLVEAMEVLPPSPSRQKDGKTMDKKTLIDNLIKILPENADITYATVSWWDEDDREHKNWDTEELCEGT